MSIKQLFYCCFGVAYTFPTTKGHKVHKDVAWALRFFLEHKALTLSLTYENKQGHKY